MEQSPVQEASRREAFSGTPFSEKDHAGRSPIQPVSERRAPPPRKTPRTRGRCHQVLGNSQASHGPVMTTQSVQASGGAAQGVPEAERAVVAAPNQEKTVQPGKAADGHPVAFAVGQATLGACKGERTVRRQPWGHTHTHPFLLQSFQRRTYSRGLIFPSSRLSYPFKRPPPPKKKK